MDSKLFKISTSSLLLLLLLAISRGLEGSVLREPAKDQIGFQRPPDSAELRPQNIALVYRQSQVNVKTTSGLLVGSEDTSGYGNSSIYKFLSVPYAEAPIKSLRFQKPVEIDKAEQVVDASKFGKTCPQFRHLTQFISPLMNIDNEHQTSEDCLHLNLFVPSLVANNEQPNADRPSHLEPNKQLPVIVWIPGEGFDFADARQFDGSHLAHKTQSIVVTVQYRVGVLGFLHAPKLGIAGNMGIHDQLMALRWVKKNIAAFGGDSDRVTVMGRFSGSMSISAMITAPNQELIKWNGQMLFNRVAMLSGIAVTDWIIDSRQAERVDQLEKAALEKNLCNATQIYDKTCLQEVPVEQLLPIADYGWRLVVDNELIGQLSPIEAIRANQFASNLEAVLLGETGMEGTLCLYRHMLDARNNNYAQLIEEDKLTKADLYDVIRDDSLTYFRYNLTKSNPIQLALESLVGDSSGSSYEQDTGNGLGERLREKYLNSCSSYMVKLHSNQFKRNILARNRLAGNRMDSSKKPVQVFHYELKYKPTFSLAPDYIKTAAHGDDIPLIFGLIYNQPRRAIDSADLLMTRTMMAMIGNFVHGNDPLLSQHSTIDSIRAHENETTSVDEIESNVPQVALGNHLLSNPNPLKRSWLNEGKIYSVELNEYELNSSRTNPVRYNADNEAIAHTRDTKAQQRSDKSNVRLIVMESPQSIVDQLIELRNQQPLDELQLQQYELPATRSQQLLEHHRKQQTLEDNLLLQRKAPSLVSYQFDRLASQQNQRLQSQQNNMTLITESSFMTMLVFSVCIMILALISICLGLFLLIVRQTTNTKGMHTFAGSSSTCNICADSQPGALGSVLEANRKDERGFNNVFAKLRSHNTHSASPNQSNQTCASASLRQPANKTTVEILNQRQEIGAAE